MITLIAALGGFVTSIFPDLMGMFRDRSDKKHELIIMQMQLDQQKAGHSMRLEEINAQADIAEARAIYKTYNTGIAWVDALNGTVRPVLAYAFFCMYLIVKIMQFSMINLTNPLPWHFDMIWGVQDQAIFAGIIAFYYGQRAMQKIRQGK